MTNKKALVTGASRGIGFEIAKSLTKNGVNVVITGRKEETLKAAAEKIGCGYLVHDAAELSSSREIIKNASELLGGLDILVNNAGIFAQKGEWDRASLLETNVNDWQRVIDTNASSVFFMMQAAVSYMLEHEIHGNILNITSASAYEPVYGAYGASKTLATALTRGWGKMFAPSGITINAIAPGPVATEMNGWHEGDPLSHPRVPFGRFLKADEVAGAALFLLSDSAKQVCGETLLIDGAYSVR